ncbi:MAG: matrixin family metalloprotease [Candidatus Melainabacteria bacterium]|nr:matrixin family metalloprotease [Candidatus Melainabacteria bacterium]
MQNRNLVITKRWHGFIQPVRLLALAVSVCLMAGLPAGAKSLKPVKDVETENEVIKLYNQALKYSKAERNVHARVLLEKAATYDPTSVSAYIHATLSEIYHDLGNPERAVQEAQKALRFDGSMKILYYNLGLYCKDANRYEEGIAYLTKFAETASGDRKVNALSLIDSLRTEQSKMGSFSNNDPDYLGQLLAENSAHSWAASRVPLKIYIEPTSSARGFLPGFPQIARNAFVIWYQASGKKLSFNFVDNVADADINVEWTDGMLKIGDEKYERTKAGLTTTTRRQAGIEHARIQIRTVRAFSKEPEPEDRIKETCLHEIGHALGLNGHSSNTSDIMYFGNTARQLPALTRRDKATIARLYQAYQRFPMQGVDTSFPYPAPATDIPRLTDDNQGDTTGGGEQLGLYQPAAGSSTDSDSGNPGYSANTNKTDQLLPMPEIESETALPGITYPTPEDRSANASSGLQQSPPSYQQPAYQQQQTYQQPQFQQPGFSQQPNYQPGYQQPMPFPQQPAQAWQSAPAPYYPANSYPAAQAPAAVPYSNQPGQSYSAPNTPPGGYTQQTTPYGGQQQYGQPGGYGTANSANIGPEQTPSTTPQNNPMMQFAQQFFPQNGQNAQGAQSAPNPIMQFAQQMFKPNPNNQSAPGTNAAPGPGLQPMVDHVMKMFQPPQQQPPPTQ